jgi:hypothetical protein
MVRTNYRSYRFAPRAGAERIVRLSASGAFSKDRWDASQRVIESRTIVTDRR